MRISFEIKFVPIVLDAVSGRARIVLFLVNVSFEKQGARHACEIRHPLIREQAKTGASSLPSLVCQASSVWEADYTLCQLDKTCKSRSAVDKLELVSTDCKL